MLRRRTQIENHPPGSQPKLVPAAPADAGFPGTDQPYGTDEHPTGVLFYHGRLSFFLPYHLLQTMRYDPDQLLLVFATDNVTLTGRGLHALYVQLAKQKVFRVVQQDERFAAIAGDSLFIARIEREQRTRDKSAEEE